MKKEKKGLLLVTHNSLFASGADREYTLLGESSMKNDGERLYLGRKCGKGMSPGYVARHYFPSLIVFLIVLTLTFVMVFISSMTGAIDRMIVLLGCGSIETETIVDVSSYDGAVIDEVKTGDGIIYAESGKSLVHLKGSIYHNTFQVSGKKG